MDTEPQQEQVQKQEKHVIVQPFQQVQTPIQYNEMGIPPLTINPSDEDIFFIKFRIPRIAGLNQCVNLLRLSLRTNLIEKIEGLENCVNLEELELYDNKISRIQNLENLTKLKQNLLKQLFIFFNRLLDISFNNIKVIENISHLKELNKLFLISNKIKKIENVEFQNLTMLELGANKITKIENLNQLPSLRELYLAKNRIEIIENLESLQNLETLALSANKLKEIQPNIRTLKNLQQLQLSENFITIMENLNDFQQLELLDISHNKILNISGIENLQKLQDLWLNYNLIENFTDLEMLKPNQSLLTIYIEHNPVSQFPSYKMKLLEVIPGLTQINASQIKK